MSATRSGAGATGRGDWDVAIAETRVGDGSESGNPTFEAAELFHDGPEDRSIKMVYHVLRNIGNVEGAVELAYRQSDFLDEDVPASPSSGEATAATNDSSPLIWGYGFVNANYDSTGSYEYEIANDLVSPIFPDGAFMWRPDTALEVNVSYNSGQVTSTPHFYTAVYYKPHD